MAEKSIDEVREVAAEAIDAWQAARKLARDSVNCMPGSDYRAEYDAADKKTADDWRERAGIKLTATAKG